MKRYFLGIDIGTFESRGILIDESFRVAADASVPHGMDNPQPGWFEQDAETVWWGDLCKLCRALIKQSEIRPEQIACVGTSALGTDCLPVDEQCRPLYQADGSVNEAECGLYCRPDQLAACAWSTDIVGIVTPEAAAQTGLAAGTPVITGTGDSTAEAISVGLVEPDTAFFQYGSSMFYYYCTDHFVDSYVSPQGNGALKGGKAFTVPGTYCLGDGTNAAGTLTRWVRDLLYSKELDAEKQGGENAYAVMAREAAAVPPGSDGLIMLPYIYGERSPLQDAEATGMLFGLKGTHGRAQINRAALEAVGYSTYQHLLLFEELGVPPRRIITAGGGTKNAAWMQIICDMAGMPLTIPEPFQCSSYGDAMLAALGVGVLESFAALRAALPQGRILQPDRKNHEFYQDHYPIFRDLYLENRDRMHKMQK